MALAIIPFLAGYSRGAPPRTPSRALSRPSVAPAQVFHAAATQVGSTAKRPSEFQLNIGQLVDSLSTDYPRLFVEPQDLTLFDDAVELHGPGGQRLTGIGQYTAVLDLLRFSRRVAMDDAELTHRISIDGRSVRVRWSAKLWIKDPTLGLTSFRQEPVLVHVDGVSRYDLDGKGIVHLHALENVVMSGPDKKLLDFPNLEYLWRLPELVPAPAAAGAGGWAMPVPAHGALAQYDGSFAYDAIAGAVARGAVAYDAAAGSFAYDAIGRAVAATKQHVAGARSTAVSTAVRAAAPSMRSTTLRMRAGIDETYEGRRPGETPVERAARERQEDAEEAARLKALRTPAAEEESGGFGLGLPGFLSGMKPDGCETNYDCERPMVCCDLIVARVCCSSGLGLGPQQQGQMGLQGQLIPIPVKKDEPGPYPNQGRAPPQGNQPW